MSVVGAGICRPDFGLWTVDSGLFFRHPTLVQRLSIDTRNVRNILRCLEPPFNFKRRHADPHQLRQHFQTCEILRTEQIFPIAEWNLFAIRNQIVGEPAGLGAFAPIGRASAESFAGEALARVRHTQRAVDENFQGE